jgi:hypothetical protein
MRTALSIFCAVTLALGCADAAGPGGVLTPGVWGGDRANLIVTPDSVRAEFDCASGWLDGPVALDAHGRFGVSGSYRFEAGPVGAPVPAYWTGQVTPAPGGALLSLSVVVSYPGQPPATLGPYHLRAGQRLQLGFCA